MSPMIAERSLSSERGVTMMEMLVSVMLFGVVSLGVCKAFIFNLRFNTLSEQRTDAIMAAQQRLDVLRLQDPATMPSSGTQTQNTTIGRFTFEVRTIYCSPNTYCTTNSRFISIQVLKNNQQVYNVDSVYSQLR